MPDRDLAQVEGSIPTDASQSGRVARVAWIASAVVALLVLLLLLFGYGIDVLLTVFAGVLMAVLLRSIADGIHRITHLPRGLSPFAGVIAIIGLATLAGFLFAPGIANQVAALSQELPRAIYTLGHRLNGFGWGRVVQHQVDRAWQHTAAAGGIVSRVPGFASSAFGAAFTTLIVIFLGLYLAAEPALYVRGLLHLVPYRHRAQARDILTELTRVPRWWLVGQLIDMCFVGALTGLGLWLIGLPLAAFLGLLAALFNFIPNFGPLFSLVPALLLALADHPHLALYVLGLYVVVQSIEGYVLQPIIQRHAVSLPPALTLTVQVLLGLLVGPLGLLVAVPLTAVALVLVKRLYVLDVLNDQSVAQ